MEESTSSNHMSVVCLLCGDVMPSVPGNVMISVPLSVCRRHPVFLPCAHDLILRPDPDHSSDHFPCPLCNNTEVFDSNQGKKDSNHITRESMNEYQFGIDINTSSNCHAYDMINDDDDDMTDLLLDFQADDSGCECSPRTDKNSQIQYPRTMVNCKTTSTKEPQETICNFDHYKCKQHEFTNEHSSEDNITLYTNEIYDSSGSYTVPLVQVNDSILQMLDCSPPSSPVIWDNPAEDDIQAASNQVMSKNCVCCSNPRLNYMFRILLKYFFHILVI